MPKQIRAKRVTGPIPWSPLALKREVEAHRIFDCPLYEECLTRASAAHWTSFSCYFCTLALTIWEPKKQEIMTIMTNSTFLHAVQIHL